MDGGAERQGSELGCRPVDEPRRLAVDLGTVWIMPSTSGPFEVACGDVAFVSERPEAEAVRVGSALLDRQVRENIP